MRVCLHLTQDCNLSCRYCYVGAKSPLHMTEETAQRAVDFAVTNLAEPSLAVTFFGGEPLLQFPLIQRTVAYARSRTDAEATSLRFAVNTNGTILTREIARFLSENHFHVFLSIDGTREAHDANRGFPNHEGSFSVVERNLDSFLRLNPCTVTISVITPTNVTHLAASVDFLAEKGVRFVMLTPDHTADWEGRSFRELEAQYRKLARLYSDQHRSGRKLYLNLFDDRIRSHIRPGKPKGTCQLADSEFAVAPDGTIFPCSQFVSATTLETRRYAIGHVAEGWYADERQEVISQAARTPASCRGCALDGRCVNYCGCVNARSTGRIDEVSPFLCSHERMLFPIVDEAGNRLFEERNDLFLERFYNPGFSVLSALEQQR